MLRKCYRCGAAFEGVKEQRLCPECRDAAAKAPRMMMHTCLTCGGQFEGGPRAMYCPQCREERKKATDRKYKQAQRAGSVRKIGSTDICERCGKEYTVNSGLQRYCPDCAAIALSEKTAPTKREFAARKRAEDPDYKHRMQENGTICPVCGKVFTATKPSNACSPECAKILRQQAQKRADQKRRHKDS